MLRGSILCAALLGSASAQPSAGRDVLCGDDCNVDLTPLEEFTADYHLVIARASGPAAPLTTMELPPTLPSDHGSVAVHARNLQFKLDNHLVLPEDFGNLGGHPGHPNPLLSLLAGHDIRENLHINGLHGQASFHLASPVLNACIQVDLPLSLDPNVVEMHLRQDQQIATAVALQRGFHVTVDDVPGVGLPAGPRGPTFILTEDSQPEMVIIRPIAPGTVVGLKFSNYRNTVGDAFATRACEVEAEHATQTMLAENPDVRDFFAQRLAEHQKRLQALLESTSLNTRFDLVPLQLAAQMLAPVPKGCTNDVLAETAPMATSTFQSLVLGVCSFVMGVTATYGAMRKKAAPSDAYYQVSA